MNTEIIAGQIGTVSSKNGGIKIGEKWFNRDKKAVTTGLPEKGALVELTLNAAGFYTSWKNLGTTTPPMVSPLPTFPRVPIGPTPTEIKNIEIRRMNALARAIEFIELKKETLALGSLSEAGIIAVAKKFENYIEKGE